MLKFLVSEKSLQSEYTKKVYDLLSEKTKNEYEFYVVSSHPNEVNTIRDIPFSNKSKIIFDYADEWHQVPSYYQREDIVLILKEYSPIVRDNQSKLIPFVVAYNYDLNPKEQKSAEDRSLLLFSSMWLTPSRIPIKEAMSVYENQDDCLVIWNKDFSSGLSKEEYREKMRDSLITVCPSGYMSPEIAKIQEALVAGNIIITSERPDYHYYEDNPFFVYKNYNEIPLIVEYIKNMSIEEKQKIIDKGNEFYNRRYSPNYFASLIEKRIQ